MSPYSFHRVQVSAGLHDLIQGETLKDKCFFCDGLVDKGKFVEQTEDEWQRIEKSWLVANVGGTCM
jgi:hypothetical protein